jgi:hypothetical protein
VIQRKDIASEESKEKKSFITPLDWDLPQAKLGHDPKIVLYALVAQVSLLVTCRRMLVPQNREKMVSEGE